MAHLTTPDVAAFRARTLDRARIEAIGAHVRECTECARLLFTDPALQQSAQSLWTPEPERRPWRIALAAAAVILLLTAACLALWLRNDPPGQVHIPPPPRPPVEMARVIHDGAVAITLDANGALQTVSATRPDWNDLVSSALRTGAPPVANRTSLSGTGEVLRGNGDLAPVKLIEPVASVVESDRPRFRWSTIPGRRYQVIVVRDGAVAARSELLSGPVWTPDAPLTRGETHAWQLIVMQGESEQTVPPPDAPPARFHVLSEAEAQELRDARASGSLLVTGLVASKLGLEEIAASELRAFAEGHRDLAAASRLAAHYDPPAPTTTKPDQ